MRPIKFRAWDKTNKCWFANGDVFDLHYSAKYGSFMFDNDAYDNMGDVEMEWEQFTGLLDKNGNEIYEGDVISCCMPLKEKIDRTEWSERSICTVKGYGWAFGVATVIKDEKSLIKQYCGLGEVLGIGNRGGNDVLTLTEVVGNIHENPELLK